MVSKLIYIIKSEILKLKRSYILKLIWIMPLTALILSYILMSGSLFQLGAFNWWYMFFLPGLLTVFSTAILQKDSCMKYRNVLLYPGELSVIWLGKVLTGILFLFVSCLVFFLSITIGGYIAGRDIPQSSNLFGSFVLIITFAWQVPFCMLLTARLHIFGAFIVNYSANILFGILSVKNGLWLVPYAIPARLMCPVLKLNPNGVPLEVGSPLLDTGVIIPGLATAIAVCIMLTMLTAKIFRRQEAI